MRLDGLLREEEHLPNLPVDEPFRDELEHLDLAWRGLLLELPWGSGKRNDFSALTRPARRRSVKAAGMIGVAAQDLVALDGVHAGLIGLIPAAL